MRRLLVSMAIVGMPLPSFSHADPVIQFLCHVDIFCSKVTEIEKHRDPDRAAAKDPYTLARDFTGEFNGPDGNRADLEY